MISFFLLWIGFEYMDYIEIYARRRKMAEDRGIPIEKVQFIRQGFSRKYVLKILP